MLKYTIDNNINIHKGLKNNRKQDELNNLSYHLRIELVVLEVACIKDGAKNNSTLSQGKLFRAEGDGR